MESKIKPIDANIIIITGLSGAGKTVALRSLEDMGFFCVDNLPLSLLDNFLSNINRAYTKIGVGVDIREGIPSANIYELLRDFKAKYKVKIVFLEADDEVLIRRYKETRRPHPLVFLKGELNLQDAISEEKRMLFSIRDASDKIIDTSTYSPHQLRKYIMVNFGSGEGDKGLSILLMSFGFKFGVPENLDMLFDVRFLPNPYFIPELKALNGLDIEVCDFVMKQAATQDFLNLTSNLLDFLLPKYIAEGRSYFVIGIGCTGGKHRSPVIVKEISKHIDKIYNLKPQIIHRDLD